MKEPDMERPYKVGPYRVVGIMAILLSGFMLLMYIIPGSGSDLVLQEWTMVLGWSVLGAAFGAYCKWRYKDKFADHIYFVKTIEEPQDEPRAVFSAED